MIKLSTDQERVLKELNSWFKKKNRKQFISLGGYAGTGKTTLIALFRRELKKNKKDLTVAFCSYTGKAARVLQTKLVEEKVKFPKDFVGTIHSLIYSPIVNKKEEIIGWELKDKLPYELIILDEASMVDRQIWEDLLSFAVPILAVGDHGQLPPIKGNFNLMENPQLRLEEIHRQERDNPIINLSIQARKTGLIPVGDYGINVKKLDKTSYESQDEVSELLEMFNEDTLVICGYNNTRIKLNKHIRSTLGFELEEPQTRDKVICLRNNHKKQIFNGMVGTIRSIEDESKDWYYVELDLEDGEYKGLISKGQFNTPKGANFTKDRLKYMKGDLFDFGYALTVHKAQGSQAKRVILFEERFSQMDDDMWKRWLYTAVTRAEEELYIVG